MCVVDSRLVINFETFRVKKNNTILFENHFYNIYENDNLIYLLRSLEAVFKSSLAACNFVSSAKTKAKLKVMTNAS